MAKLEDITTFNLDGKTYAVTALSVEARDLLSIYLKTEDDIKDHKIALLQSQHALNSIGNMFRDLIKEVEPLPVDEIAARQAAEVIAAARQEAAANEAPRTPARGKKPARVK